MASDLLIEAGGVECLAVHAAQLTDSGRILAAGLCRHRERAGLANVGELLVHLGMVCNHLLRECLHVGRPGLGLGKVRGPDLGQTGLGGPGQEVLVDARCCCRRAGGRGVSAALMAAHRA